MKKKNRLLKYLSFLFLLLVPSFGNASWSVPAESDLNIESTADRAICYNSKTNVVYSSLKKALDEATSGQEVVMYIGAEVTCNEDITIKSGVTLTIPFLGKAFDSTKTGKNISSDSTLYKIPDADSRDKYGGVLGDKDAETVKTYRSILVKMKDGADIINNGTLRIGGACSTFGNNGYYSEVTLGKESSIVCNKGSTFDCFGYVKEDSADYLNQLNADEQDKDAYDNSFDFERMIHVNSGATLNTSLAMYDARTAGDLTRLISAGQTPFWEWDIPCLQTYTKIDSGSTFTTNALLVGPSGYAIDKDVNMFCNDTSKEGLFYLTSGYVGLEYLTSSPKFSSREFNARKTNFFFNGTTSVGYIYAKAGVGDNTIEMDTRKTFLPVSNRANIVIGQNQSFTTDKKMKFLSDTSLLIQKGGTFNANNQVIFHKSDSLYFDEGASVFYRAKKDSGVNDARLICNGKLIINANGEGNGAIGAFVEHKSNDGTASFDISKLGDSSKLSVKESEGAASTTVSVTSSGMFSDGEAAFSPGNAYRSMYNGTYCWNGPSVRTHDINVVIIGKTDTSVVLYTIQYADDASGTNAKDSDLTNATSDGTVSIPKGKYAKVVLNRGESVTIKDENGNVITSNYSSFFAVDRNLTIEIVPSETYLIDFTITADNGKYNGTGHFALLIYESKTGNSGTFTKVFEGKYSTPNKRVTKGYYFYLETSFESVLYNWFKSANAIITKDPDVGSKPNWNVRNKSKSPNYLSDANYTFATKWNYWF